jgi:hypothetical protein
MKKLMMAVLLAGTALAAMPAKADIVRTLGGQDWTIADGGALLTLGGQPSGNQPLNNPCIICGANQPNQTNTLLGFGYTDYGNQGNQTSETYFSSGILRDTNLGTDTISAINYSGQQLIDVVNALGGVNGGFSIGIDVNDTNTAQTLESFFLLDLSSHQVVYAFLPDVNDGVDLLAGSNGTGFPDFTLNGLTTAVIDPTHQYAFFARMTNTNDGPDSFFIVPNVAAAVPGPIAGAGLPGLLAACFGLFGLNKYRRRRRVGAGVA